MPEYRLIILLLTMFFALPVLAQDNIDHLCDASENSSCCMASLGIIKENNYPIAKAGVCPDGYKVEMLKCIDSLQWCEPEKCLELGGRSGVGGIPGSNGWKLVPPCCEGLQDREPIDMCGSGYAGGYAYICIRCGDKVCDPRYENACNCAEDCK